MPAEEIAAAILQVERWSEFTGWGPIPGIRQAELMHRTNELVGTQIRVVNRDGSTHVEEIIAWELPRRVTLKLHQFSPPVSRLATQFEETWTFSPSPNGTHVERSFMLYPKSWWSQWPLRVVACCLRAAIKRHLRQMATASANSNLVGG